MSAAACCGARSTVAVRTRMTSSSSSFHSSAQVSGRMRSSGVGRVAARPIPLVVRHPSQRCRTGHPLTWKAQTSGRTPVTVPVPTCTVWVAAL